MATYQARPHPTDANSHHDDRYYTSDEIDDQILQITGGELHLPLTVVDSDTIAFTLVDQELTAVVLPGGISHTELTDIGTNTHAQIDTVLNTAVAHVAATAAHGATGSVMGTTNVQTATNKTFTSPVLTTPTVSATGWTNAQHAHSGASSGGVIDHVNLSNKGTNTHAQIDTALATAVTHQAAFTDVHGQKGSRTSATFTTTLATETQITGLGITIGAGETWQFDIALSTYHNNTGGIKVGLGASAALASLLAVVIGSTTSRSAIGHAKATATGLIATPIFNVYTTDNGWIRITGTVTAGASPVTFYPVLAANTAGQSAFIDAGSVMTAQRIS